MNVIKKLPKITVFTNRLNIFEETAIWEVCSLKLLSYNVVRSYKRWRFFLKFYNIKFIRRQLILYRKHIFLIIINFLIRSEKAILKIMIFFFGEFEVQIILQKIDWKHFRNPPGFAFIEFEDPRDAEDSVRGLDGTRVSGVSSNYSFLLLLFWNYLR